MIVYDCEQGTPEWFQARAGVITASMFAEVRKRAGGLNEQQERYVALVREGKDRGIAAEEAGYKTVPRSDKLARAIAGESVGDFTEKAKDYAFRLAVERISNEVLDAPEFEGWQARRGRELEAEARSFHAFLIERDIEETGFIATEDRKFGASADGLIGEDGGSEYKCFLDPSKLRAVLFDGQLEDVADQVQGNLWLTGRQWWDFVLYCPALSYVNKGITIHRVERDDDYIEALEADLVKFDALVCEYEARLRAGSHREVA